MGMSMRTVRERQFQIHDLWRVPVELIATLTARLSRWFSFERWTNLLTIFGLVLLNLIVLLFILQGQENRALTFTILALVVPLMLLIPELSIVVFILAGTGIGVNVFFYVLETATGERAFNVLFLGILSARAIYEYLKMTPDKRPRVFTWFLVLLVVFWIYYIGHVAYIYLFRFHEVPPDAFLADFGLYRPPAFFRYFDRHMLWIGVLPLTILLADINRAKRVTALLGIMSMVGIVVLIWEYFAPLPDFMKILFQLRGAAETAEGYRVRDPASLYMIVTGFSFALYSLGYYGGWRAFVAVAYILGALYVILVTKNRALWGALMLFVPIVLLWKPLPVLSRQVRIGLATMLFGLALLLHPTVNQAVTRITGEAVQRWQRNYAYGGDPRLDPSYQVRVREREAWEFRMQRLTPFQQWFGAGLEETYGRYISLYDSGYQNPRFRQIYTERIEMHFAWLARLLHIGIIGTGLLAVLLTGFFVRAGQAFFLSKDPFVRMLVVGITGGMVAALGYDLVHSDYLNTPQVAPVIFMWSFVEAVFHWKRTNQVIS